MQKIAIQSITAVVPENPTIQDAMFTLVQWEPGLKFLAITYIMESVDW